MSLSRFNPGAWEWPDTLAPLMQWAERRGMDVYSFKSERQAFFMIKGVSRQKVKFPKRGQSCFPHLIKMQRTLCPNGASVPKQGAAVSQDPESTVVTRVYGLGTFGAADEGRRVSIDEYTREKELAR